MVDERLSVGGKPCTAGGPRAAGGGSEPYAPLYLSRPPRPCRTGGSPGAGCPRLRSPAGRRPALGIQKGGKLN